MSTFRTYENVLVSGVEHDFRRPHRHVPRTLLTHWVALIVRLGKVLHPGFDARPLTDADQFQTEQIPSDGPYGSSEDYYTLDYVFLDLIQSNGTGVRIAFEYGRQGGGEPLGVETRGLEPQITSYISADARSARAKIFMCHDEDKNAEVEAVMAEHTLLCQMDHWKNVRPGTVS